MSKPEKNCEDLVNENAQLIKQISEMSSSTHALISSKSHLESILLNAAEGIILFNPDGTVKSLNLAAQKIFGYQEIELMYQHIPHLFNTPDTYKSNIPGYLKRYLIEHPDTFKEPLYGYNIKGKTIPLHISISEVSSEMIFFDDYTDEDSNIGNVKNNYALFACLIHDLTHEIESQKRLEEKNSQLEQAYISLSEHNQMQSEFLAKISHELLTPLNGIIGMADLLKDEVQEQQQEFVQVIKESGLKLESIISNILAFDNNDSLEMDESPLDFVELFSAYEEKYSHQFLTRKLTLSFNIDDADNIPIFYTLVVHIRHILDNLIDNALKFTLSGGAEIHLKSTKTKNNLYLVQLSIKDTGIGISLSDQDKIFEPFTQLENAVTRQFGGVGMGLSIVKQLLNSLDGQLAIQSELDKGTSITLNLLMKTAHNQALENFPVSKEKIEQLRQLLEDDFELLITTSINELQTHFKQLVRHIEQQEESRVFASFTLLKNIAEQLGAEFLIKKMDEVFSLYKKDIQTEAAQNKLTNTYEEISEEIDLIKSVLVAYQ